MIKLFQKDDRSVFFSLNVLRINLANCLEKSRFSLTVFAITVFSTSTFVMPTLCSKQLYLPSIYYFCNVFLMQTDHGLILYNLKTKIFKFEWLKFQSFREKIVCSFVRQSTVAIKIRNKTEKIKIKIADRELSKTIANF
jgi:hypothetical protein